MTKKYFDLKEGTTAMGIFLLTPDAVRRNY
jgi:hypothetical protein